MPNWWQMDAAKVAAWLGVDPNQGLSFAEAGRRLREKGENSLHKPQRLSALAVLIAQFKDFMVLVLLGAAAVSGILHEYADAMTILAIVLLNAVLGFYQEYRAERSLLALQALSAPQARVRREGRTAIVPAREVVPGDLLLLEAGDRVAADARLSQATALAAAEAALTGESVPVAKSCAVLGREDLPLGDRTNMVFGGTNIVAGRGEAIVVATGMSSEIGQIAGLIEEAASGPTPLQSRLEQVGRWLVFLCLFVCAAVGAAGVARGESLRTMFMAAVSLGVAAIPEGLPAVVTISLAIGVQRMVRRAAIVRRLPAVETLGCATVICSDKTGTLTMNEMRVATFNTAGDWYEVTGVGYDPAGSIAGASGTRHTWHAWPRAMTAAPPPLATLLAGAACNNAELVPPARGGGWRAEGDPTDAALLVLAAKAGLPLSDLARTWPRLGEVPFSSERKRMSVINRGPDGRACLFVKGAADVLLAVSRDQLTDGGPMPLEANARQRWQNETDRLSARGLRVLALAYRLLTPAELANRSVGEEAERDLTFLGLVGMSDPPRPESARAVKACRQAGILTVMITGDHPLTARAIAQEIGLLDKGGRVVTGNELDRITERDLLREVERIKVYARVSPRHKLRVVRALKAKGHVVAMTGDGVNDAPAVKEADIGVAMGKTGTDVTKEAASLVIMDDNFATIVAAIEEGRAIYDNIRKFIRYLLGCNTGEILTMFLGMLCGLPLPLLPMQILWINLVTDGLPALALGLEPAEKGIMSRPPRPPKEGIFAAGLWGKIVWQGMAIGLCTLVSFGLILAVFPGQIGRARTVAFSVLVFSQLVFALACRSEHAPLRAFDWSGNPYLLWTILGSSLMHLAVIYLPWIGGLFHTVPLGPLDWLIVLGLTAWSVLLGAAHRPARRLARRTRLVKSEG